MMRGDGSQRAVAALAEHRRTATFDEVEALLLASGWKLERMRGSDAYYV
jgi:hypothetical protein